LKGHLSLPSYFFLSSIPLRFPFFFGFFDAGFFLVAIGASGVEQRWCSGDNLQAGKKDAAIAGSEGQPVRLRSRNVKANFPG
jgi:hypothetical protein